MNKSFNELNLNSNIVEGLKLRGITSPTEVQESTIPKALENIDIIAESHTGSGKTLAYLCPIFQKINTEKKEMLLVLDNLQDPGNLGTIFRTAEAAGVTGIILSKDSVDIYNPKVIRSTMGAIFRMPLVYVEKLTDTIEELRAHQIQVYAAHLEGKNAYDEENYLNGTAYLIGNEGNGLRQEVADCADTWIRIPMLGQAESLNAAVAASILMFGAARQRRK